MTVHAKPCGFRTHLGNRCAIPTFPPPRRLLDSFNTNQERSFPPPSPRAYFRLILQLEKTLWRGTIWSSLVKFVTRHRDRNQPGRNNRRSPSSYGSRLSVWLA